MFSDNKARKALCLILAVLTVISAFALSSCKVKKDDGEDDTWDYTRPEGLTDFATSVRLNESNLDSDFNETGRGYVTVELVIDGDTAHFWNNSKTEILKVRFIAIDTPESTGKVEPWGKPASIYTKRKLNNAEKIVVESDTEGVAAFDSTGSRYLAWVWYKNRG